MFLIEPVRLKNNILGEKYIDVEKNFYQFDFYSHF
jgi:hypothetical protein